MADARNKRSYKYLGVIFVIFGLFILHLANDEDGVPPRHSLSSATGAVQTVIQQKSSVKFLLQGNGHFQHLSQSGDVRRVYAALSASGGEPVTVLFDPDQSWQPVGEDHAYRTVFEIRMGNETLLGYEEALHGWQTNQRVGQWLGWLFVLAGLAMLMYVRLRKQA